MRNPFRKQRKLPGAREQWNPSEHFPVGDDQVAVPADQLPPEMHGRLDGVRVLDLDTLDTDITGHAIFVDMDAAEEEAVESFMAQAASDGAETFTEDEMQPFVERALNNPENWMRDNDQEGARYSLFPIDLTSGEVLPNRIAL